MEIFGQNPHILKKEWILRRDILILCLFCRQSLLGEPGVLLREVTTPSKILFVDDEENVIRSLQRLFIDEGYDIFAVTSAGKGLEILRDNEIAVIVSDQRMPQMSGAEFLEAARKIRPDSVRIILTGYADAQTAIDAINKGGAYRYIAKPWNDDDLILAVRGAVEQYRLIGENRRLVELTKKQNEESDEVEHGAGDVRARADHRPHFQE